MKPLLKRKLTAEEARKRFMNDWRVMQQIADYESVLQDIAACEAFTEIKTADGYVCRGGCSQCAWIIRLSRDVLAKYSK